MTRTLLQGAHGLALLTVSACSDPPSATTLEGAFERVASAVDAQDARRLYWDLDLEARHSLMSIHRDQIAIRERVARYPAAERSRARGAWSVGAEAKNPGELFEELCRRDRCLSRLREKLGGIESIERSPEGGVIRTTRGGLYSFRKGADGRFGLLGFGEQFQNLKREVARDRAMVERTSAQYQQVEKESGDASSRSHPR